MATTARDLDTAIRGVGKLRPPQPPPESEPAFLPLWGDPNSCAQTEAVVVPGVWRGRPWLVALPAGVVQFWQSWGARTQQPRPRTLLNPGRLNHQSAPAAVTTCWRWERPTSNSTTARTPTAVSNSCPLGRPQPVCARILPRWLFYAYLTRRLPACCPQRHGVGELLVCGRRVHNALLEPGHRNTTPTSSEVTAAAPPAAATNRLKSGSLVEGMKRSERGSIPRI